MVNKDELKGKANETIGKVTGDESKELKGKAQGIFGKAKDKIEDGIEAVEEKAEDVIDKLKHKK